MPPNKPDVIVSLFTKQHPLFNLPQVAEANPPQPMDAAGEGLLYYEFVMRVCHAHRRRK